MQATDCLSADATDQELITAALTGNQCGYTQLVERYQDRLYTSIRNNVGCAVLAEDIVQDAFVKAFVHLASFRSSSNFYTWLYRIALNSRRKYFRKGQRLLSLDAIDEQKPHQRYLRPETAKDLVEQREECEHVRRALARLAENHRTILILREFEGFDYETIADVLHVKPGTVRSRLSRARARLKEELKSYVTANPSTEATPTYEHHYGCAQ